MLSDFKMIVEKFPDNQQINIYPIGDLHIGSKEFNERAFLAWREMVLADINGYVVIIGDMMNMGLKNSKTNVYEELLTPQEQKEACYKYLEPIKHRIIAACSGNHEYRAVKETSMNPLYDVMCWLHIEDVYRENGCFLKVCVGKNRKNKPNTYGIVLTHGKSRLMDERWTYSVDGCDVFISGHTHDSLHKPLGKLIMDTRNEVVYCSGYHHVVVEPFQSYGGYALRGKYTPSNMSGFQKVTLDGHDKRISYTYG